MSLNPPFALNQQLLFELYERYTAALFAVNSHSSYSQEPCTLLEALTASQFQAFLEVAYWASHGQVESRPVDFTLLLVPRENATGSYVFEKSVPFNVVNVPILATALDSHANSIGVWMNEKGELVIWGFIPTDDVAGLVASSLDPGQVLISFKDIGEHFTLLLSGTRGEFVRRGEFLSWLVPDSKTERYMDLWRTHAAEMLRAIDLKDIAMLMRKHRRGGTLLVVLDESNWMDSLSDPITFLAGAPYERARMATLRRTNAIQHRWERKRLRLESPRQSIETRNAQESLETIARLTSVDGATVVSYDLDVLAFGAKIQRKGTEKPERVLISEPFEESSPNEIELTMLGATRHHSAAQFVFDQRNALAFVASQDGILSVMRWDMEREIVTVIRPAEIALP